VKDTPFSLISIEENPCVKVTNASQYDVYPFLPMGEQQLSTVLRPVDPDAAQIIKLRNTAVFFGCETLVIALKCGELLAKKKDSLSHGQWLPWVKRNLPFTDRTARRYIKVWHNRQTLKEEERHKLTLRQFYFAITDSKSVGPGLLHSRQATNDS
jgi:hypothetical protein